MSSQLVAANSLNSLNNNLARLAGPALGGLLLGSFGFRNVVLVEFHFLPALRHYDCVESSSHLWL